MMENTPQKSLLIAVRDASSISQGVRFVTSFFKNPDDIAIALFYVMTKNLAWESLDDPWAKNKDEASMLPPEVQKVFRMCSNALQRNGFSAELIKKIARRKQRGTIGDIVREMENELHDAVILGKRSTSFFEDVFCGNKGHELLAKDLAAPIWFCRNPEEGRKNVLLCLDGSPVGEKVADHVGFMLQGQDQHSVKLVHVNKGQKNVDTEKTFQDAAAVLKSYGLSDSRINTRVVKSLRVTKSILDVAEKGKFAAIALGALGRSAKKGVYEKLIGSQCRNIFDQIDKAALWVVP